MTKRINISTQQGKQKARRLLIQGWTKLGYADINIIRLFKSKP
jgi:hypothetical protein